MKTLTSALFLIFPFFVWAQSLPMPEFPLQSDATRSQVPGPLGGPRLGFQEEPMPLGPLDGGQPRPGLGEEYFFMAGATTEMYQALRNQFGVEAFHQVPPQEAFVYLMEYLDVFNPESPYYGWHGRWAIPDGWEVPSERIIFFDASTLPPDYLFLDSLPDRLIQELLRANQLRDVQSLHPWEIYDLLVEILDPMNPQSDYYGWDRVFPRPQEDSTGDPDSIRFPDGRINWDNVPDWVQQELGEDAWYMSEQQIYITIMQMIRNRESGNENAAISLANVTRSLRNQDPENPSTNVLNKALEVMDGGRTIIGSCYDFVVTIFREAGHIGPTLENIHVGKTALGPFANLAILRPGDWVMYDNQTYSGVEHSGIFLYWLDFDRRSAMILSYPGGNSNEPGRFKEYDISRTWFVLRARD